MEQHRKGDGCRVFDAADEIETDGTFDTASCIAVGDAVKIDGTDCVVVGWDLVDGDVHLATDAEDDDADQDECDDCSVYDGSAMVLKDGGYVTVSRPSRLRAVDEPMPDVDSVISAVQRRHSDVEIRLNRHGMSLRLVLIRVPEGLRGAGRARAAMDDLLAAADRLGLRITLTPEPLAGDRKTSRRRLVAWYRSLGFVPNRGRTIDLEISDAMYRYPLTTVNPEG